jgi:hypothetical protein
MWNIERCCWECLLSQKPYRLAFLIYLKQCMLKCSCRLTIILRYILNLTDNFGAHQFKILCLSWVSYRLLPFHIIYFSVKIWCKVVKFWIHSSVLWFQDPRMLYQSDCKSEGIPLDLCKTFNDSRSVIFYAYLVDSVTSILMHWNVVAGLQ